MGQLIRNPLKKWCPGTELNRRHRDFQSARQTMNANGLDLLKMENRKPRLNGLVAEWKTGAVMYLYVFETEGACKVGISQNPQRRLQNLQGAHFMDIKIVAVFDVGRKDAFAAERAAHLDLGARFERRREWFRAPAAECCRAAEEAIRNAPDDLFVKRRANAPVPGVPVSPSVEAAERTIMVLEAAARLRQKPGQKLRIGRNAIEAYEQSLQTKRGTFRSVLRPPAPPPRQSHRR